MHHACAALRSALLQWHCEFVTSGENHHYVVVQSSGHEQSYSPFCTTLHSFKLWRFEQCSNPRSQVVSGLRAIPHFVSNLGTKSSHHGMAFCLPSQHASHSISILLLPRSNRLEYYWSFQTRKEVSASYLMPILKMVGSYYWLLHFLFSSKGVHISYVWHRSYQWTLEWR